LVLNGNSLNTVGEALHLTRVYWRVCEVHQVGDILAGVHRSGPMISGVNFVI
jgi:hypothetical protein